MPNSKYCILTAALLLSGAYVYAPCDVAAQEQTATSQVVVINGRRFAVYTAVKGDTLYSLSRRFGVSQPVLTEHNPKLSEGLKVGQKIKIPLTTTVGSTTATDNPFAEHTVQKGDTFYSVARQYATDVATLRADNPNVDPAHLALGQVLRVRKGSSASSASPKAAAANATDAPASKSVAAEQPQADAYSYHVVHKGETLAEIAERFKVSEAEIAAVNGLKAGRDPKKGTLIKIPRAQSHAVTADTSSTSVVEQGELQHPSRRAARSDFEVLPKGRTAKIALLLPMQVDGSAMTNYAEMYQGFLVGLDSVRRAGHSTEVTLYDTSHNYNRVDSLVRSGVLDDADIIVGPVYEDELQAVVEYAEQRHIPVVSPLANLRKTESGVVFQMAPPSQNKYEKVRNLLDGSRNIVLIYGSSVDREFERDIKGVIGTVPTERYSYAYEHPSVIEQRANERKKAGIESDEPLSPSDLSGIMRSTNGKSNTFVVMSDNEVEVDRILTAIASANISLTARSRSVAPFVVVGNHKWSRYQRYQNTDRSIFFTDHVVMLSTYHSRHDSAEVRRIDSRYVEAFGSIPTLYAYRGFDAAVIFVSALYGDIDGAMLSKTYTPLQTPYRFSAESDKSTRRNTEWVRINYHGNNTITTE